MNDAMKQDGRSTLGSRDAPRGAVAGVLQARMSSSRLPGKVLKPILGVPMLARQLERLHHARSLDRLIVATSRSPDDDAIEQLCREIGTPCHRGSLDDVLDRCYQAVALPRPDYVVRLTGDCPLADWTIIDDIVAFCIDGDFDYASNALRPTWPDGLDVEIARFDRFEEAWREAILPSEREHVMPFLHRRPDRYRLGSFECARDLSALRWTVDEAADFDLVVEIYAALYPSNPQFDTEDILALLNRRPDLMTLNTQFERNEGLTKSQLLDAIHLGLTKDPTP